MILAVALSVLFSCVSSEGSNAHFKLTYLLRVFTITYTDGYHNLALLSLGLQLISVNAMSVNASEGMKVDFVCQTSFSPDDVIR